jgi:hypothetical protein
MDTKKTENKLQFSGPGFSALQMNPSSRRPTDREKTLSNEEIRIKEEEQQL